MWIVKLALRRPYTFLVLAILITLLGVFSILRTPTDIFPNIKIPVVAAIWRYTGLSPDEMATRLVLSSERTAQTTVNDVEHVESQSLTGESVVKYFFQPNVNEELSFAQITGVSQTGLRQAPPGTTPPFILAYNASSVPIVQLALSSDTLSEAQLFDLGNSILRTGLSTVQGASMPYPYGGLQRQVQVDLNPDALRAQGLSGNDVTNAIGSQNSILPAGTQKIGDREYFVTVNANPRTVPARECRRGSAPPRRRPETPRESGFSRCNSHCRPATSLGSPQRPKERRKISGSGSPAWVMRFCTSSIS